MAPARVSISDTVSVDGGLAIEQPNRVVRLGVFYAPTPVPSQEGRTNYVDNTRVGGSLGLKHSARFAGAIAVIVLRNYAAGLAQLLSRTF